MQKSSKSWVIGFVEGEGCFTYTTVGGKKYPRFYITQKGEKGKNVLEMIRETMSIEGIELVRDGKRDVWYLYSSTAIDVNKRIVDYFNGRLMAKKPSFKRYKRLVMKKYCLRRGG